MVPIESFGAVSYSPSVVTMALSYISSEIKPDIGRKSWFFSCPLAFGTPVRGSPSEYWQPIWYGETRMVGLPDGEKNFEDMYNCGMWQTDGQTDIFPQHSPCYAYTSCGKNFMVISQTVEELLRWQTDRHTDTRIWTLLKHTAMLCYHCADSKEVHIQKSNQLLKMYLLFVSDFGSCRFS